MHNHGSLISSMINKRLNETIKTKHLTSRNSDSFKHAAAITTRRGRVLTIGTNKYHTTIKHGYTIHAEVDTMQRALRPMFIKYGRSAFKRRIPVDITVIRTNMLNSHPCFHCIKSMVNNPIISIKRVYYSINGDDTQYCSLSSLIDSNNYHISKANKINCCGNGVNCLEDEEDGENDEDAEKPAL